MRRPTWGAAKPTWSLYDQYDNPEHQLFESAIMEYNDITGIQVIYYQRDSSVTYDDLYGEHTTTGYLTGRTTKMVYEVSEEPNLWNSFGMTAGDVIIAHIPMGTYKRDVSATADPKIGDAVKIHWYGITDRAFEVVHIDDDDKAFQLKKMVWIIVMRPYRFSEQSESAAAIATTSSPISAYGDNEFIEAQSDLIDDYSDVDTKIYGY